MAVGSSEGYYMHMHTHMHLPYYVLTNIYGLLKPRINIGSRYYLCGPAANNLHLL